MQDNFLTWNGSHGWTNWMREGVAMMSSNHFANQLLTKNFIQLDPRFARLMKEYGITEADWFKLQERDNWKISGYKKIYEIQTISDFWKLYNNWNRLGGINYKHFFIMKNDVHVDL